MTKLKTLLSKNLKNSTKSKIINVNGTEVNITKIGLRHLNLIKNLDPEDEKAVQVYAQSFMPNCNWAEGEFVLFHVEHFNQGLSDSVEFEGNTFNVSDVKIDSQTEFEYNGETYKFKPLYFFEMFESDEDLLSKKYVSGPEVENWGDMPAFVNTWANKIRNTISVTGSNGLKISDGAQILEVFLNGGR